MDTVNIKLNTNKEQREKISKLLESQAKQINFHRIELTILEFSSIIKSFSKKIDGVRFSIEENIDGICEVGWDFNFRMV